jgi:mycothiol synthase
MSGLPEGYLLRHATPGDVAAAQQVLDAAESADCGEPRRHDTRLEMELRDPRLDLARDVWVVVPPEASGSEASGSEVSGSSSSLAAVAIVWSPHATGEIPSDQYVHPDHRGRGLCTVLLDAVEERAAELAGTLAPGVSGTLMTWCEPSSDECFPALKARGFVRTREYFEMRIDLDEGAASDAPTAALPAAPTRPRWPEGITARLLRVGRDEPAIHIADTEAFAEHHMVEPRTYTEWRLRHIDRPDFDPGLWIVAWDADEIAGYVSAFVADDGGLVDDLAVRRAWRRRGVGLALLQEEFRALATRGVTVVRLFVDAQNVTGAARLYERAGMRIARRFEVLEKKPGRARKPSGSPARPRGSTTRGSSSLGSITHGPA